MHLRGVKWQVNSGLKCGHNHKKVATAMNVIGLVRYAGYWQLTLQFNTRAALCRLVGSDDARAYGFTSPRVPVNGPGRSILREVTSAAKRQASSGVWFSRQ